VFIGNLPSKPIVYIARMVFLNEVPLQPKSNRLPEDLAEMDTHTLSEHIITRSVELYHDQPKPLQVEAVTSLVQGKHTFVRAGTGFGKTRISEMFIGLFDRKVVVLVLVPLDSLGDDQVRGWMV
jgi:superfamily II DNA or RNA helicase